MSTPPTPPPARTRRLARLVLCAVCGLVGVGGGFGLRMLRPAAVAAASDDDHDEHDEHTPAEPPPTPEQLREKLDVAVQSGDFDRGLTLVRELREDADASELSYREALCLEGQDRWDDAELAYKELGGPTATVGERVVAAFGLARCRLHADDTAAATPLLDECDRLAGHLLVVRSELAFQRARIAVGRVPQPAPGPFAPKAVAWRPIELTADRYLTWLTIVSASVFSSDEVEVGGPVEKHPAADAEQAIAVALAQPVLHPASARLRLAAANLAFRDDRLVEAVRGYRALLAESPHGEDGLPVGYNLGLALIRTGSPLEARTALLRAADREPRDLLAALGCWWVGRIALDLGDTDDALKKWYSIDHEDRTLGSAVALGEAVVHALNDDDERTGRALAGAKIAVATPHPELADAFACRERFSRAESELRGDGLADAIRAADYGRGFGPAGTYLMGRWLTACGRGATAAAVYDTATERPGGGWAVRMTHAVGEHLLRTGHTAKAKAKFTAVAAADAGTLGDAARLKLAEIAVRDGDGDACVRACRGLLTRPPADRADRADRDEVLRLMGRGYELLGRPRDAADCFAGRTPR